jgi:hypothetical protein
LLAVKQAGEALTAQELADGIESLELMVKSIGIGKHLWTSASATLFLDTGTQSYTIPSSGVRAVSTFAETTTTADEPITETSIAVTSTTGMSLNDVIGIKQSSTSIHWTTIAGLPGGLVVTLTSGLTAATSSGAAVYVYTAADDLIGKPLKILNLQRRNGTVDTPIDLISEEEYFELPSKASSGTVTQAYYDARLSTGILYVWNPTASVNDTLKFRYQRTIEDADAAANNMDFPQEWLETLKYQLALRIAPEWGVEPSPLVVATAQVLFNELTMFDTEDVPVFFQPETNYAD